MGVDIDREGKEKELHFIKKTGLEFYLRSLQIFSVLTTLSTARF